MGHSDNGHVGGFRESLEQWTDERFISSKQLYAVSMFSVYLVNLAEDDGWDYVGHSFKRSPGMCCLTVKADVDSVPSIVFTSGRTHTSCVVIFIRKLEGGMLEWRRDRYR